MEEHRRNLFWLFFPSAMVIPLMFLIVLLVSLLFHLRAYGSENIAEFQKLEFATMYDNVTINGPFAIYMEPATRNLRFYTGEYTKFSFLAEITPRDYRLLRAMLLMRTTKESVLILNSTHNKPGRFVNDAGNNATVGDITVNVESDLSSWLNKYESVIRSNFATCRTVDGDLTRYTRCDPLRLEARILRMERDKNSVALPLGYIFPNVDYADIYAEILNVKEAK